MIPMHQDSVATANLMLRQVGEVLSPLSFRAGERRSVGSESEELWIRKPQQL
jgi:hypothetical protein